MLWAFVRTLVRKLTEYAEAVERATAELMPHHICTYPVSYTHLTLPTNREV